MVKRNSFSNFINLLKSQFPSLIIKENELFKKHTTFRIGGKIRLYVEVESVTTLLKVLQLAKTYKIDYFILGCGSNLLVSDKKINKLVIKINLNDYVIKEDKIICGAGLKLFKLNQIAINASLSGLEWSFGIPASVGGAIKMNAGCFGYEMKDVVECVYFTDGEKIYKKTNEELEFSYRHSFFTNKNYVILKVCFNLHELDSNLVKERCFNSLNKRKLLHPQFASAGSIFKKCGEIPVPILIEKCKLKGFKIGDAQISTKHCGFIVNLKNAKFNQVYKLILKIKDTIFKKFGIIIKEEIIILKN